MGINKKKIKKILVKAPNWIGDTIMAVPAVRALRANFPRAFIAILVKKKTAPLWRSCPYSDKIFIEEDKPRLKKYGFDLGVVLPLSFSSAWKVFKSGAKIRAGYPSEFRGPLLTHKTGLPVAFRQKHLVLEYLDIVKDLGLRTKYKSPVYFTGTAEEQTVEKFLRKNNVRKGDKLAGVCPGAAYGPAKMWPKEKYLKVIKELLKKKNTKIVLFGSDAEKPVINYILKNINKGVIITSIGLSIAESAALIKKCSVFITNDSGPMHIAAALGIPVVAIFGSTSPVWTRPLGGRISVVYEKVKCSPCFKRECDRNNNKYVCLKSIEADEIIKKAVRIIR